MRAARPKRVGQSASVKARSPPHPARLLELAAVPQHEERHGVDDKPGAGVLRARGRGGGIWWGEAGWVGLGLQLLWGGREGGATGSQTAQETSPRPNIAPPKAGLTKYQGTDQSRRHEQTIRRPERARKPLKSQKKAQKTAPFSGLAWGATTSTSAPTPETSLGRGAPIG